MKGSTIVLGGMRTGVIPAQDMFSVYMHPPPGKSFPRTSIFAGREVAGRVKVLWAQWSVVHLPPPVLPRRFPLLRLRPRFVVMGFCEILSAL